MENPQLDKLVVRADPLTGCKNLIAFSEEISALCTHPFRAPFSLVTMDLVGVTELNRLQGRVKVDFVLRWMALLAQDTLGNHLYRIGGDEFVAILSEKTPADCAASARQVFEQLNRRARNFSLRAPVASMAVIHFTGAEQLAPADIFTRIYEAIARVKNIYHRTFHAFQAEEIEGEVDQRVLQAITNHMIERVIYLGARLDESLELAFTDTLTGLPNQRMVARRLEEMTAPGTREPRAFALLLIDGDDLRRYNEISYAEGDAMIHNLGQVIRQAIRPEDFLGRWKVGDEFMVLLAGADGQRALAAGGRICQAVQETSQHWLLPVTVSVGVAVFPDHGKDAAALIHAAELANKASKLRGKNCVTLFAPEETGG